VVSKNHFLKMLKTDFQILIGFLSINFRLKKRRKTIYIYNLNLQRFDEWIRLVNNGSYFSRLCYPHRKHQWT